MSVRAFPSVIPRVSPGSETIAAGQCRSALKKAFIAGGFALLIGLAVSIVGDRYAGARIAGVFLVCSFVVFIVNSRSAAISLLFLVQPFEGIVRAWMGARYLTFAYASLVLVLLYGLRDKSWPRVFRTPIRYLILMSLWAALSFFWSVDHSAWLQEVAIQFGSIALIALLPLVIRSWHLFRAALFAYVVGSVLYLLLHVLLFAEAKDGVFGSLEGLSGAEVTRVFAIAVLFLLFLSESERGWSKAVAWSLISAFVLGCMMNTTRGTLVALAAAVIVNLGLRKGLLVKPVQIAAAACLAALIFGVAYRMTPERWDYRIQRSQSEEVDAASSGRSTIWRAAFAAFSEDPLFGLGAGNFVPRFGEFYFRFGERYFHADKGAHSVYIATMTELGVLGILLFALFLLSSIKTAFKLPPGLRHHALSWMTFLVAAMATMASRETQMFWLVGLVVTLSWISCRYRSTHAVRLGAAAPGGVY